MKLSDRGWEDRDLIRIVPAVTEDIPQILEIECEAITPPWTYEALLSELLREDSFFIVARSEAGFGVPDSECNIQDAEIRMPDSGIIDEGQRCRYGQCANRDSHGATSVQSEPEDIILGFLIFRRIADEGELLQIAVNKAYRRRGGADALMDAALVFAKENALDALFLEVRKSNVPAIALYKKHGFLSVRFRKDYYSSPTEDAVVMSRLQTSS